MMTQASCDSQALIAPPGQCPVHVANALSMWSCPIGRSPIWNIHYHFHVINSPESDAPLLQKYTGPRSFQIWI